LAGSNGTAGRLLSGMPSQTADLDSMKLTATPSPS
jgi:hypothetical protein